MSGLRQPHACPVCAGTRILRILYGSPTADAMMAVDRGEALLGGCIVTPGQPDWECSRCRHRWYDPQDPARRRLDAVLEELASRTFEPPVPALTPRADGLHERIWKVKLKGRASRAGDQLSLQLRDRALREHRRGLDDQRPDGDAEAILDVRAEIAGPRSYLVTIARGGDAPNWDKVADTFVMHAMEALMGPIVSWQGVPRALWKLWPLPPPAFEPLATSPTRKR